MCSRKKLKTLSKKCPECKIGFLSIVEYSKKNNGVIYTISFEECEECAYSEKIKMKRRAKDKIELDNLDDDYASF